MVVWRGGVVAVCLCPPAAVLVVRRSSPEERARERESERASEMLRERSHTRTQSM